MEISQKQFEILSFLYGTDKWISPKDIPNCEKETLLELRTKAVFSTKIINGEECYRINETGRAKVEWLIALRAETENNRKIADESLAEARKASNSAKTANIISVISLAVAFAMLCVAIFR